MDIKRILLLMLVPFAVKAQDYEVAALVHLSGQSNGVENCLVDSDGDGQADSLTSSWGGTIEQVRAFATSPEFMREVWSNSTQYADWQAQMPFLLPKLLVPRVRGTNVLGLSQLVQDADTGELEGVPWSGSPPHTSSKKWDDWRALCGSNAVLQAQIVDTRRQLRQARENLETALTRLDQWRGGISNALVLAQAANTNALSGATKTFGAALRRSQLEGLRADRDGVAAVRNSVQATRDTIQAIEAVYERGGR